MQSDDSSLRVQVLVGDTSSNHSAAGDSVSSVTECLEGDMDELFLLRSGARAVTSNVRVEDADEVSDLWVAAAVWCVVTDPVYHGRDSEEGFCSVGDIGQQGLYQ